MKPVTPKERVARIASAHAVFEGATFCKICAVPWPCATFEWATNPHLFPGDPWESTQEIAGSIPLHPALITGSTDRPA